ncbi:hypothetical protein JCM11491_002208 [Sporobolomyces phaffii]
MLVRSLLVSCLAATVAAARETLEEAAVHTRELIAYRAFNVGTLISNYPHDADSPVAGLPFGLQEYYAPYPESNGDLLLLAMPIAAIYRNALPPNQPNLTMTINDMYGFGDGNLAAGRMRVALYGTIERVDGDDEIEKCKQAYLRAHPDARGWVPPGGPHSAFYARFRVNTVYAFDGFGDVSYIGWIPLDLYRASGEKMRSEKQAHKHWPVPRQPEQDELVEPELRVILGSEVSRSERLRIQF